MEANEDVARVRVLVENWLRAWEGPDLEGLCGCTHDRAAFFLRPDTDDDGQTLSWRVFSQRLKTVLVRARHGPPRPRLHVEKPRFTIEVKGAVASVFWHSQGSKGWKRTRAL